MQEAQVHTAAGPAAGYFFQPDRALFHLTQCKRGESVAIELIDDISIIDKDGKSVILEQDKNTIKENSQTFKDRSKDVWNTLYIWIKLYEEGKIDIEKTKLICATNVELATDTIIKKIADIKTKDEADKLIVVLSEGVKNPPVNIKKQVEYIFERKEALALILPLIELSDNNDKASLDIKILDELQIPDENANDVLIYLKGWVHDCVTLLWDDNKPAILTLDAFITAKSNAQYRIQTNEIKIRVKRLVKDEIESLEGNKDRTFVKQLEILKHPDIEDIIFDAIEDFLCSENERLKVVLDGNITKVDLQDMDNRNHYRWKNVFRRHIGNIADGATEETLSKIAYEIYNETISGYEGHIFNHRVEDYITHGSFLRMSDDLLIGWHPKWKTIFKASK